MQTRKRARSADKKRSLRKLLEPVWDAVRGKDVDRLCAVLSDRGAELQGKLDTPNASTKHRDTALIMCAEGGFVAGVDILIREGAKVDLARDDGCTPLFIASQKGYPEVVSLLLKKGAAVDQPKNNGSTPLFKAAKNGHSKVVRLLLKKGAAVNLAKNTGATPLFKAAQKGYPQVVSLLLKKGAALDHGDNDGCTPLFIAAAAGHRDVVNLMLKRGASANLADNDGYTALYIAAQQGHPEIVSILVEHGETQIELTNNQGCNALHAAAFDDRPEVCLLLVAAGLDPEQPNNNDETALSHYGCSLDLNDPDDWDGEDDNTRPRLAAEQKRDRIAQIKSAREAFVLHRKREENWQRRAPLMHALVGSGLRLTAVQAAEHAAFQAAMDYAAPIPPVPVDRLRDILSNEGFVRAITACV